MKKYLHNALALVIFTLAGLFSIASHAGRNGTTLDQIYLYRSPSTLAFFHANDGDYKPVLQIWRGYLKRYGADFREISKNDLLSELHPGVLVLGSALLLGDDERAAIQSFTQRGGSVLATWGTGGRDGAGRWHGYQFLETTFDLTIAGEIDPDSDRRFLMPFGDGPLTWPLPAGRRMYFGQADENPLRVQSTRLAASYMNWAREPGNVGIVGADNADGAIAYSEHDGARRVYMGMPESTWEFFDKVSWNAMMDAMMAWLRRDSKIWMAAWPNGKSAAILLEMDTEDKFTNAMNFARDLEKAGVRGTFYCLTSEARKYPNVVRELKLRGHEIAYHADIHIGFAGQTPQEQYRRLQSMRDQMSTILGPNLSMETGFRAPTESYDRTTEILLRGFGIRHHAADPSSSEDRLPFFSKAEAGRSTEDAIVVLPRTSNDDINFGAGKLDKDQVTRQLVMDFDQAIEMGALGLFSVHSQNYGTDGSMTYSMPTLFKRIAEVNEKTWIGRADDIASWWRMRARIKFAYEINAGLGIVDVLVRAPGAVDGVSFIVTHAVKERIPSEVEPATPGTPPARILPIDSYRSAIVMERATPGAYRYKIRF